MTSEGREGYILLHFFCEHYSLKCRTTFLALIPFVSVFNSRNKRTYSYSWHRDAYLVDFKCCIYFSCRNKNILNLICCYRIKTRPKELSCISSRSFLVLTKAADLHKVLSRMSTGPLQQAVFQHYRDVQRSPL